MAPAQLSEEAIQEVIERMSDLTISLQYQTQNLAKKDFNQLLRADLEFRLATIQPWFTEMCYLSAKANRGFDKKSLEGWPAKIDAFSDTIIELVTRLQTRIEQLTPKPQAPQVVERQVGHEERQPIRTKGTVKLPRISLPEFDGTIDRWLPFKSMFEAMVHNSDDYDAAAKFHYLVTAMKIPSSQVNVLDGIPVIGENYPKAWEAVCSRYNDVRKILDYHVSALHNVKKMTSNSPLELRKIIDSFQCHVDALAQLQHTFAEDHLFSNLMVNFLVVRLLDDAVLREWRLKNTDDTATWRQLHAFLVGYWRSLDDISAMKKPSSRPVDSKPPIASSTPKHGKTFAANSNSAHNNNNHNKGASYSCVVCSSQHALWACEKFKSLAVKARRDVVGKHRLCFNCLGLNHAAASCKQQGRCRTCCQPHHSMLHLDSADAQSSPNNAHTNDGNGSVVPGLSATAPAYENRTFKRNGPSESTFSATTVAQTFVAKRKTLLSTVSLTVADRNGRPHQCRALLDSGSDASYITESFARRLKLPLAEANMQVEGINGNLTTIYHATKASISSRYTLYEKTLECWVMPVIAGNLPGQPVNLDIAQIPAGYFLADPNFHESLPIDMLIQSDVFISSLRGTPVHLPSGLMLLETSFGWIIAGSLNNAARQSTLLSCHSLRTQTVGLTIDDKLDRFFNQEEGESAKASLTPEEKYCENLFQTTTTKGTDGKFIVRMPFRSNWNKLGSNIANANRALRWQEAKRQKDPSYDALYVNYMNDYVNSGRMTEVQPPKPGELVHYLPHHGVVKMTSSTTKLRPVFNAASQSETGLSLNDVLCVGKIMQPESFDIMMRFREHSYVITADITKMYLQTWIHPEQRDFMRILWRVRPEDPIKHFQLNTVTFGTAPAPGLATRALLQLALDSERRFPRAAAVIKNSFYVDDLVFGVDVVADGVEIRDEIRTILAEAGMPLCKFSANNADLLVGLPPNDMELDGEENSVTKTLGIVYDTAADQFSFRLKPMKEGRITKTSVLSETASIYDIYGWIGPVILSAKLFMKKLWKLKLGWKELLPAELQEEWNEFRRNFHLLNDIKLNRRCFIDNHVTVELHGFSDASIVGYGAVIYALSMDQLGHMQTSIICAKSRVAPESQKTLARLELCGATLLAVLIDRVRDIFSTPIAETTLWCDSTIVLSWIPMTSSTLQTFVGNRVAAIQELTTSCKWKHIPGEDNPADVISRGLMPEEIESCVLWWNGPSFFSLPKADWPDSIITLSTDDPEVQCEVKRVLVGIESDDDTFSRFESNYDSAAQLIRAVAANHRGSADIVSTDPLSIDELEEAEMTVIKVVQQKLFPHDYELLQDSLTVSKKSNLLPLAPFMDNKGVIRVGGRLGNCPDLTWEQKHPIILPACNFTMNIIKEMHEKYLHPTQRALLAFVRNRYWPLRAKSLIRKAVHGCLICFRMQPTKTHQFMADLPAARVTMAHPFTRTAVDYAGFFMIRTSLTRNSSSTKAYVAMFKCMCTGAIHLELVTDLSSQAFLAALDRFVSRRGLCKELYSDNGTCFVGANTELKKIVTEMEAELHELCIDRSIKWIFTTPLAPHAGGIYESGIKTMKHHLNRVLGDTLRTFEQFTTILCKIEAIVNSRPLIAMTDDPRDLTVLTPGHFLIGHSMISKPERDFVDTNENRLDRWEKLQQVQQHFWRLWSSDYLRNLQTRPINFREPQDFSVGQLVLLNEKGTAPMSWLIGRIIALHPGQDGITRTVTVRTAKGEYLRHVRYISILPTETTSNFEEAQNVASVAEHADQQI